MKVITELPDFTCSCGNVLNAVYNPNDGEKMPTVGDVTVCVCCGSIYQFGEDMMPRPIAEEDALKLLHPEAVASLQEARVKIKENYRLSLN